MLSSYVVHAHIVGVVQSCMINAFALSQQVVDVLNNILEENNLNGWMDLQQVSRLDLSAGSVACLTHE